MGQSTQMVKRYGNFFHLIFLHFSGMIPNLFNTVQLPPAKIRILITLHLSHQLFNFFGESQDLLLQLFTSGSKCY